MGLDFELESGQTPLDEDEIEGLLIPTISSRAELDEFEQLNIEKAFEWILSKTFTLDRVLTEPFIKELHKKMYSDVWKWAGSFRITEKSIGCDPAMIGVELRNLIDDTKYWIENKTFSNDEITIRFSHRIVKIHCFPNGNGRHSRMIADLIALKCFGTKMYSWGNANLTKVGEARKQYLKALRKADENNYRDLIKFARS